MGSILTIGLTVVVLLLLSTKHSSYSFLIKNVLSYADDSLKSTNIIIINNNNNYNYNNNNKKQQTISKTTTRTTTTTQLNMVFDFLRDRSKEGLDQLNNLANAAYQGEIKRGILDIKEYTSQTNKAFAIGLTKSRIRLLENIDTLLTGISPDDMIDDLMDILLQADLGLTTAEDIINEVKSLRQDSTKLLSKDDLKSIMRGKLVEAFDDDNNNSNNNNTNQSRAIQFSTIQDQPTILFIMGANGMGKTTTIGKLAHRLKKELNQTVLLAACDTFRAGAVEQLQQWANQAQVDMIGPDDKATTPSAVLYKALDIAMNSNNNNNNNQHYDTILIDTSGRLSNNDQLTQELAKMKRVIQKKLFLEKDNDGKPILNNNVPHETLLVIDAAQGRMALDSAKIWNQEIGLSGLILTKLDGSARGGSVVSISRELQLPVKLIGIGEGIDDLRDFNPESFVDGLLGIGTAGGSKIDNEGEMLALRLKMMRQERDLRSKEKTKTKTKLNPPMVGVLNQDTTTMEEESSNAYPNSDKSYNNNNNNNKGGKPSGNPNRSKNKKRKKNKK